MTEIQQQQYLLAMELIADIAVNAEYVLSPELVLRAVRILRHQTPPPAFQIPTDKHEMD